MTYIVSGGALNSTYSLTQPYVSILKFLLFRAFGLFVSMRLDVCIYCIITK